MNQELEYTLTNDTYLVMSVEESEPPQGVTSGIWYRYVIGRGNSKIEGMKSGTLATVRQHAQTVADDLNARATRGGSFYAPRQRK
jgi:hypothetical protein